MTKSMGDYVLGDIQGSSNRRPGMTSHIGRQHREDRTEHLHFTIHAQIIGAPFLHDRTNSLQATAHLHGKGGIAFSVFPPGDKPTTGAVILLDESSSLWLHLDIIEPPRFGATIGQATIDKLPIFQSQQINQVNADQAERELESIDILLLPGQTREREQRAKSLHRHSSFLGRLRFHLEGAERVPGSDTIIDGIIEDSSNVSQMDGASIHGRTPTLLGTKPRLEPGQPIFRDALEGERLGMRVKRKHLLNGHQVDITSSRRPAQRCIGAETSQEPIIDTSIRAKFSSHPILHLDSRQANEITSRGQLQNDFRDTSHLLQQEEICGFIVHGTTHLLRLGIPLRRKQTNTNRELGMRTLTAKIELQGSQTTVGNTTNIQIIMHSNHFSEI